MAAILLLLHVLIDVDDVVVPPKRYSDITTGTGPESSEENTFQMFEGSTKAFATSFLPVKGYYFRNFEMTAWIKMFHHKVGMQTRLQLTKSDLGCNYPLKVARFCGKTTDLATADSGVQGRPGSTDTCSEPPSFC